MPQCRISVKSYVTRIRSKLGKDKFIHPAARIIVENDKGDFLFIKRRDNGKLGIPSGSLEEDESIEECIKREVYEETGLTILSLKVIGISSQPSRETVSYPNGDKIQYFTIEFYTSDWKGDLNILDTQEVSDVTFMDKSNVSKLPYNEQSTFESLTYYLEHGSILLK